MNQSHMVHLVFSSVGQYIAPRNQDLDHFIKIIILALPAQLNEKNQSNINITFEVHEYGFLPND